MFPLPNPFLHQQSAYCLIRRLLLCFTAGAATHQRLTTPPGPNSICLLFPHLQRICFNLTLSILEMRCNPFKPLFESASQPRLFPLRSPVNSVAAALRGSHGPKSTDRTRTDGQTVNPEESFLLYPPKHKPQMALYRMHTCTIFLST